MARVFGKLGALAVLLTLFSLSPARADIFIWNNQQYASIGTICGETALGGCLGTFQITMADETLVIVTVGSDGNQNFDPYAFGFNTGDVIHFQGLGTTTVSSLASGWTNVSPSGPLPDTWVLPATISGCGPAPAPSCTPMGDFVFSQPFADNFPNSPNGGVWGMILDPNGNGSAWVFAANTAASGHGEILFFADPTAPVPEPATMFLLGGGLILISYLTRKRKPS